MPELLKNQRNLFIVSASGIILLVCIWYYGFHQGLSSAYSDMKKSQKSLISKRNKYKRMKNEIINIQNDWDILNEEFETVIQRIPNKSSFDRVSDAVYIMLKNNGLSIINYSASNVAIDKKTILIPDSNDEIIIEKIPIDIEVKGSFVNFGKFLEKMASNRYRLTASNIDIKQMGKSSTQIIKFISYAYFQTEVNKKSIAKVSKPKTPKKKATPSVKKIDRPDDAPDDVPDWMFEPITETEKSANISSEKNSKPAKINNEWLAPEKVDKNKDDIFPNSANDRELEITNKIITLLDSGPYTLEDLKFMIDDYDSEYSIILQYLIDNKSIAYNDNDELVLLNTEKNKE
ncbi:MAG: hypothetical protein CMG57_03720 [Candidatus Marinimicrobia bacterium]|nr:hypothetical protein [Candidatus Neomarinimicrobiota bacterium]